MQPQSREKSCYLLREIEEAPGNRVAPAVTIAYTCVSQGASSDTHARAFIETYRKFPPLMAHRLVIICNGGKLPDYLQKIFAAVPCQFFERDNVGWDIGGYIELAGRVKSDLLVCFGESVQFHRAGWLARLAHAWVSHGPGIYGFFSSFNQRPHLNTTAFACSPALLAAHPMVRTREERYAFEHGPSPFWRQLFDKGFEARLVTWDGAYETEDWRRPVNILCRGDQKNCLVWSKVSEQFRTGAEVDRQRWAAAADTLSAPDVMVARRSPRQLREVGLVYVHLPHDPKHVEQAVRFVRSYRQFPPDCEHDTIVVCNGSPANSTTEKLFAGLPNVRFLLHDDSGWDIGAYQKVVRELSYGMMAFFGGSTYFHRSGWLLRMWEAFEQDKSALFGAMGHQGAQAANVWPHLRTNGFWCDPVMLKAYPRTIVGRAAAGDRYEFEHGKRGLTQWVWQQGLRSYMVTWDGLYEWPHWDSIPNGYHQGDQSNLLMRDRMTDPPFYGQAIPVVTQRSAVAV